VLYMRRGNLVWFIDGFKGYLLGLGDMIRLEGEIIG